jgi:histidinol-phosphate aminotransferase
LTRRDWLITGGIALSGPTLPSASSGADTMTHQARMRLSLNENPFGPSPFAASSVRNQLGEICRCPTTGATL